MSRVKVIVVEDELIIANSIRRTLIGLGYDVCEPAISYTEALETIGKFNPDLAMLDIQLSGGKDGIDLAYKIKEDHNIPIIFLTSNTDKLTLERAKVLGTSAYLVKPFNKDELYTSIEIALYNYSQKKNIKDGSYIIKDALFIKQKSLFIKVKFDDILFIQSDHVYVEIITVDKQKYLVRGSLNEYINKLSSNFIRVHRGYIINLKYLDAINHTFIRVNDNEIPIGKNYHEELLEKVNIS